MYKSYYCTTKSLLLYNTKMKFLGIPKYFLLLMIPLGIAKGSNSLSSTSQLYLLSTSKDLKENHTKFPKFIISDFIEEINNDENGDETHSDFYFNSLSSCGSLFECNNESEIVFPKSHHSLTFLNQKINVLNCIFLI